MTKRTKVPCGSCRACCQKELLILHPEMGDVVEDFDAFQVTNPVTGKITYAIRQAKNGDCVYLGKGGCTIYERAPAICREFDCRQMYKKRKRFIELLGPDVMKTAEMKAGKRLTKAALGRR